MTFVPRPGSVVAWWNGGELAFGVVAGEEKQRVRLVLARGREGRVTASRLATEVAGPGSAPGKGLEERRQAGERVEAVERRVKEEAASVEVELLWEIVREGTPEDTDGPASGTRELAELALGSTYGDARAAVLVALLDDGIHFVRRGEEWEARSRSSVEELRRQRERVEERASQSEAVFAGLAAAARGEPYGETGSEVERRYLGALEQLAIHGDDLAESTRATALEALARSRLRFDRPNEGAFRLLRRMGRFDSDDENLQLRRYRFRTEFPAPVIELARRVAESDVDRQHRSDLTGLEMVTIDSPDTSEIDDALSVDPRPDGGWRLGVHIADPAAFVRAGDAIDEEALARAVSHYHPDLRLPMLPAAISEQASSLIRGEQRPALSFLIDIDPSGEVHSYEIRRSIVNVGSRLSYAAADEMIANGSGPEAPLLATLSALAAAREGARLRSGALLLFAPEVDVKRKADGEILLDRRRGDEPARRAVGEAMVVAGSVAARFCIDNGVAAIYRRQSPPTADAGSGDAPVTDPVAIRRLRRGLKRGEAGIRPAPHFALGLDAYLQVTSPLRRYQDLAVQRQIAAVLDGASPPYDDDAMQRIAATTERAEIEARRAERAADEFWLLRYLEQRTGQLVEGVIVEAEPRPVIQLIETLWEQPMPALAGREPGSTVRLRIERVNPRAGLVSLRIADEPGTGTA